MLIFAAGGAGILLALRIADGADQRGALIVILAGALLMRLALLFVEPYLSTDIYRYVWDGRVQAAGINPYRYVPSAPELAHLRDAAIFPNINRADYAVTIYPPAAQAIFLAVTRLGESVVAMKLGLLAFEAATVAALLALLRRLGSPATRIAAYAWHPLPVWEIAGSGHVDVAMCALLMAGLLLFLHGRTLLAGVARHARRAGQADGAAGAACVLAPMELAAAARRGAHRRPGVRALSVGRQRRARLPVGLRRRGRAGVRPRVQRAVADGAVHRADAAARSASTSRSPPSIMVGLADRRRPSARTGRRERRSPASAGCSSSSWSSSSPHYPWYFLVLVPLLVLHPSATAWVLTLGCPLLYDSVGGAGWPGYDARIAAFTLATVAALAYDALELRRKS